MFKVVSAKHRSCFVPYIRRQVVNAAEDFGMPLAELVGLSLLSGGGCCPHPNPLPGDGC